MSFLVNVPTLAWIPHVTFGWRALAPLASLVARLGFLTLDLFPWQVVG
jgi:hypothetical protein